MATKLQFTRQVLQQIRNEASNVARETLNPQWQRAWEDLGHAADRLDAMMVRSTVADEAEVVRGLHGR